MVEWIGLAIAVAAAYFAWRANGKSDDANDIAARALAISEREERERQREREARARLVVSAAIFDYTPDDQDVIRLGGSSGNLRLAIEIGNEGDRDAGRGTVEATFPPLPNDTSLRWSDASGRELPGVPSRAGRIGGRLVLSREIEGVARGVPAKLYATVPIAVPDRDDVNDYPIRVVVRAEGADPAEFDFPLRIGRDPTR